MTPTAHSINDTHLMNEISVYLNQKPTHGWSEKGKDCVIKTQTKSIRNKRYSVCMAVSNKKIIDYTIVEGALKTIKFNGFLDKITTNTKNKYTLFMDS